MKSLKNCVKLSCSIKIYVPSTIEVNLGFDSTLWVNKAMEIFSVEFGGSTSSKALGAWLSLSGELVKENVTLVFSYCTQEQLEKSINFIYDFALAIKHDLKQEAIAIEVNNELYLI